MEQLYSNDHILVKQNNDLTELTFNNYKLSISKQWNLTVHSLQQPNLQDLTFNISSNFQNLKFFVYIFFFDDNFRARFLNLQDMTESVENAHNQKIISVKKFLVVNQNITTNEYFENLFKRIVGRSDVSTIFENFVTWLDDQKKTISLNTPGFKTLVMYRLNYEEKNIPFNDVDKKLMDTILNEQQGMLQKFWRPRDDKYYYDKIMEKLAPYIKADEAHKFWYDQLKKSKNEIVQFLEDFYEILQFELSLEEIGTKPVIELEKTILDWEPKTYQSIDELLEDLHFEVKYTLKNFQRF
jgi:hypothetical protein